MAFGDLRGYVEPCGCDKRTDKGGIQRIYQAVKQERDFRQGGEFWVFSLGNYPDPKAPEPLKDKAFVSFAQLLQPTATLFNALEWKFRSSDFLRGSNAAAMHYVLSNMEGVLPPSTLPFRVAPGVLVFGYLSPEAMNDSSLLRMSPALLSQWQKIMEKNVGRSRVMLFSGPQAELELLVNSRLFDTVILSNRTPFDQEPDAREFQDPMLLFGSAGGQTFRKVPLGGQGILRGGDLLTSRAPALEEVLSLPAKDCKGKDVFGQANCPGTIAPRPSLDAAKGLNSGTNLLITGHHDIDWLFPYWQERGPEIEPLKQYKLDREFEFTSGIQQKLKVAVDSEFVGSAACQGCHESAYKAWAKTSHSTALRTLEQKGADKNRECVACHVVGFDQAGGFVSAEHSPHLANVGCETCHGPRKDHIQNPSGSKQPIVDKVKLCQSCHHAPHSTSFDFDSYWPKIKHGLAP